MKKIIVSSAALALALPVWAELYGDTPDARHAWAVHDRNRPNPVKITAECGVPPSDAVVLFDGTEESFKRNWCHAKADRKADWVVREGAMESVKAAGYIQTKQPFGDCQLHIEWASPKHVEGVGQGRGNSGVFLMGNYEIQVLDSYETDPAKVPNPNPNYADGQASAVYAENPPLVNASRAPGVWQTYDIVFHQPIWKGDMMVHPGSVTVFHNGVLTQDHWEMEGLTTHCVRRALKPHATALPLQLQDHGNPVRFRNIWIRSIPSRYANTTHGGVAVRAEDVKRLRAKTAAMLFAKIKDACAATTLPPDAEKVNALLEVISYDDSEPYHEACVRACAAYAEMVAKLTPADIAARKAELNSVKRSCQVLNRNKVLPAECKALYENLGRLVK